MQSVIQKIEEKYKKPQVVDVRSGDTVKVHQKIREGNKERIQVFQGLVIRTDRKGSHTSKITVRRIASGIGVEKSFLVHSPLITKIEVTKRSKVHRNYLTYMRDRTGKSARLTGVVFDNEKVNAIEEVIVENEDPKAEVETEVITADEKPADVTETTPDQPSKAEVPQAETDPAAVEAEATS
jgi:large subunit ribosomal protein L19